VTGATTTCTELDAGSPSPAAVTADRPNRKPSGDWHRHAGNHCSVKFFWMRGGTNVLLGRPCRQGEAPVGPMLDPDGCLARSVMRTQPSTEEKGAVRTQLLNDALEKLWQLTLPKKMLCALDERPANGCHRNSSLNPSTFSGEVQTAHRRRGGLGSLIRPTGCIDGATPAS
jgi:hypothetical protein